MQKLIQTQDGTLERSDETPHMARIGVRVDLGARRCGGEVLRIRGRGGNLR